MFLKDLFFPRSCLVCGSLGSYVCLGCQKNLVVVKRQQCFYCSRASLNGLTHPGCRRKNGVDGLITAFKYNNVFKKIIGALKYRLIKEIFEDVFFLVGEGTINNLLFYKKNYKEVVIQPIPLHKKRQQQRGFNQSEIIASFIAKLTGLKTTSALTRKKHGQTQAKIKNKKDRYLNMTDSFIFNDQRRTTRNKDFLLVDDVVTSGATICEATKTIKKAQNTRVFVFSLAKG